MSDIEIQRFIQLLTKWRKTNITWGETCELRELKYTFADAIEQFYREWSVVK